MNKFSAEFNFKVRPEKLVMLLELQEKFETDAIDRVRVPRELANALFEIFIGDYASSKPSGEPVLMSVSVGFTDSVGVREDEIEFAPRAAVSA